ncbi:ABC transporter [Talaromyces pinophilus]|uniref:ABC transporter n=1 Tax=Talaromyces pinophilus TaxID=128442 RepID=A0A478EBU3_TALPI|nr:ABC transporter [Talaromyces pinophilus]
MASQTESNDFPPNEGHSNVLRSALTCLSSIAQTSTIPENEEPISNDMDWAKFLKCRHWSRRLRKRPIRGADSSFHENVVSQFLPARLKGGNTTPTEKTILSNSHGCVKPGEMLLVLGRPGSGCSTLLNVLGNRHDGYVRIEGQVKYGLMDHNEALKYRGQIITNSEDDIFFPTLTVAQIMDFATRMKEPHCTPVGYNSREDARIATRDFLFQLLSISHTANTRVGNEFIRGVSGDANTAPQYVMAVRGITNLFGPASVITLYQAGNSIYELFDKVLVLDQGTQIYYGPVKEARPFMEQLGFICADGANIADFLAGVTVPTERKIREGYEAIFPQTADEIVTRYDSSDIRERIQTEYDYPDTEEAKNNTSEFKLTIWEEKHPGVWANRSPVTAFSAGSLFYNAPNTSTGIFIKSGAIFVALLFNCLVAQSEVMDSFFEWPVLAKRRKFVLHHPAAWCLAQIITNISIILLQVSVFSVVIYFLVGLRSSAEAFFTFWFIILSATVCLIAFFRAVGAGFKTFDDASKFSGVSVTALLLYIGYTINKHEMHPWFVWIFWIDPLAYAYDALVSNELHNTTIPCVGPNLVPNGPGYGSTGNQACTGVQGGLPGATVVNSDQYLESLTYSHFHVWRNVGIVWSWWALYVVLTIIGTSFWKDTSSQNGLSIVPRELARKHAMRKDQEAQAQTSGETPGNHSLPSSGTEKLDGPLVQNKSILTWRNLTYTVHTADGPRILLDNVHGWVKPGMLGAVMGASGAGKTTLQDVLAQRKTEGTIKGSVLVDGKPLPINFQRSAGYCEQLDVHEPLTTVREALVFSALLRQPKSTPRAEKLAYVDTIMDLLEMHDIRDSLVSYAGGNGLSGEDRKRLTIGVELVVKPSVLIFLDEPTSGLDVQAAFNIVRFLKKLAATGQAILVTIHQPSAQLFYDFDTVLLLARGGRTVYFGGIGHQAATLKSNFSRQIAECPPGINPAEHMIDVVSDRHTDWHQIWLESPEHEAMLAELGQMVSKAASEPAHTSDDGEFAMPLWDQTFALHIIMGLFTGFTYWQVGNSVTELQMRMFALFNFIFVAPGIIVQLQPLFIEKRNIYDAREKKSRMYSWKAFVTGLIISELPYLVVCAVLFFFCFYYKVGFPVDADKAGAVFFVMLMYEFLYTGIGQFIAAYAPNATAAVLINPLIIFTLVGFCGVLVPYSQITAFWRYWLYWINPFNYLIGSLLVFTTFDLQVQCKDSELAVFNPPDNQTCGQYLAAYLQNPLGSGSNLLNPNATSDCQVCQYKAGSDYLRTVNLNDYYYGWRDAAIVVIYVILSYVLVCLLMKLRTKKSKKIEH